MWSGRAPVAASPYPARNSGWERDEHALQADLDAGPLLVGHAVHDGVADIAVRDEHVLAQNALACGAESFDGCLRDRVAAVGLELDAHGAEGLEGVTQEQVLALGVDG